MTIALTALLALSASPSGPSISDPTEILVDLRDDTTDADAQDLGRAHGLRLRLNSPQAVDERFFVAPVAPSRFETLVKALRKDPRVENVEPNWVYGLPRGENLASPSELPEEVEPTKGPRPPNDPLWPKQWSFRMVDAPEAWTRANNRGVVVAVIDTGVAFEKYKKFRLVEDLDGTRFVEGYNFISDTKHANDDHGHGTHVAGTIAQSTFNGRGVAGLAYEAKIMPLKVLSKRGFGTAGDIADAIRFAADEGAHVMNLSLGGGPRSRVMESAVAYARKKGVLVICAAGNGGRARVEYPAAYPGAFAVSSVGPTKRLAFYSSYGPEVAVAGPGGDKNLGGDDGGILQNTIVANRPELTNLYLSYQGTSMATPHVAGIAALVISAGVTDAAKVEAILRETAEDLGAGGRDDRFGHGLVNAAKAVEAAQASRGSWAHGLLAVIGLLGVALRRGVRLAGGRFAGALVGASLGSGVLSALLPGLGWLVSAPLWDLGVLGAAAHFTALWASAVPMLFLAIGLLAVPRLRGLLIGLSVGWAAHLGITAVAGGVDVLGIPGEAGWFDRAWLALQSILLFALALRIARAR
ncbi:MAG: S8 family peptidase [Myxococcota bacterium]